MLSIKIILCLFCFAGLSAHAQNLTRNEKIVFDEVAYKRRQVGEYAVISKWVIPIRYKVYGDVEPWLMKEIDSTFSQLKKITGFDIQKTDDDDEANFIFAIGKKDLSKLSPNMSKYFSSFGGSQYKTNKNFEIYRVENFVNDKEYKQRDDVWYSIKKHIVKSLGFFQTTNQVATSLFYAQNNGKLKIDAFDSHIIATLYLPAIKPGMTKDEVDKLLPN